MDTPCSAGSTPPLQFDRLCTRCLSLFDGTAIVYQHERVLQTLQYHHNMEELKASVRLGCHLCNLLLGNMGEKHIQALENALTSASSDREVNTKRQIIALLIAPCSSGSNSSNLFTVGDVVYLRFEIDLDIPLSSLAYTDISLQDVMVDFAMFPTNCEIPSSIYSAREESANDK
jgi:hypothetical protein